jgi:hypothetical protein
MSLAIAARSTLADLARADGKAELVGGTVVPVMPAGYRPGVVGAFFAATAIAVNAAFGRPPASSV